VEPLNRRGLPCPTSSPLASTSRSRFFRIHSVDDAGRTMLRRRLGRHELTSYFAKVSPCLIGMEACSAAHHWANSLASAIPFG
jgi:hypothetical protein